MDYLIDTSLAVRRLAPGDPQGPVARAAITELHLRGDLLYLTPQNLIEFRAVVTRPVEVNGLGLPSLEGSALSGEGAPTHLSTTP